MANKYVDKDNPAALDNVANGSAAAPYLTLAYALTQAAASDTILVAPTATPYNVGATTALSVSKAITFQKWDGVRAGKPEINGGDATRLIQISTASAVVFDGFVLRATNAGISNYIAQGTAAIRNVIFRNCDARGSVDFGAFTVSAGGSGMVIEDTCTIDMNLGGAVYTSATGGIACYADVILRGAAQAVFYISNPDSNGTTFTLGGAITLLNVNNYVYRTAPTNYDANHVIDSSFNLESVLGTYTRTTIEIHNPRSVQIFGGSINTAGAEGAGAAGDVWIRSPLGSAGVGVQANIYINDLLIDRGSITGYGIKIGDESPFSLSHLPNSYANVEIIGCRVRDGKYFGVAGTTQTHMIFVGNEKKHKVKNCRVIEGAYGIGIKADDTADADSYVYNNYVEGQRLAHLKTKGMAGTRWFNNHIFENSRGGKGLDLTQNTDDGAAGLGNGAIARNNIYDMQTGSAIFIDAASNLGDNDLDHSTFYCGEADIAAIAGSPVETLVDLRALLNIERNSTQPRKTTSPKLDEDGLAYPYSENWQAGAPIKGLTKIKDSEGVIEAAVSGGAVFAKGSPFKRDLFVV